jgi:hypothetical protein
MAETSSLIRAFETMQIIANPSEIQAAARNYRKRHKALATDELARQLAAETTWRLTGAGVVASLPAAIPGLGTAAQLAVSGTTITGETWLMLRNLTTLQLTVAALYGHNPAAPERKDELLVTWGLTTGAIVPAKEAGKRVGTKIGIKQFNQRVSGELLRRINRVLGTTVFTKWGTKRGGIALGRLIPFGVGALVGGGMNYATARGFASQVLALYGTILPNDEELVVDPSR